MQYHLNGFRAGDPSLEPALRKQEEKSDKVDVLIVGCGPAGLTLAAQLAAFPDINTRIVERKSGPLEVGQADGVACRSMEMFEAFGFADRVKKEAYWVNEVAFWRPAENQTRDSGELPDADQPIPIVRADRIEDVEEGLSEMPHTILNQARIHDFYLDVMQSSARRLVPDYNMSLVGLTRSDSTNASPTDYPITARFELADGSRQTLQAKYVVGCDGARSSVRECLGLTLKGEAARQLWGVMDVLPVTDFPDIRLKTAIQSADSGSLLIIPREGGYMARLYIELDQLHGTERASDRRLSAENLIAKAQAIFFPYKLDIKEVAWWSAYEIGQRVCDVFDDSKDQTEHFEPRIFIAGDACHTHSPKAGQGMNVSMADAFNLGWKLASVLRGQATPVLLRTYSEERQAKARELIDFDREIARLFSSRPETPEEAEQFQRYFKQHGRYTAGVETCYDPSLITLAARQPALAGRFPVGKRFHSAMVTRLADARPMELGHVLKADGRWRLLAFAPRNDSGGCNGAIDRLCHFLQNGENSPLRLCTPHLADPDSVIDFRCVFQSGHRDLAVDQLPVLLKPAKGRYGLTDYEKAFSAVTATGQDIFELRSIDRKAGALLVVRPDQFVASVLSIDDYQTLTDFFARFMTACVKQD